MFNLLWYRITAALTTIPSFWDLGLTLVCLVVYGVLTIPIGMGSQFLQWDSPQKTPLQMIFMSLFAPALIEEIGFRILFIPHPSEAASLQNICLWGGVNLFLFIIYHPLNSFTLYKAGYPTFLHPIFLTLATLLGIICTVAYVLTGSLLPPVLIHWIAVVIWLGWLGGSKRLQL